MDLLYSEAHKAFRQEVRDFIAAHLPDDMRQRLRAGGFASKADTELWQRALNQCGWGAPAWPKAGADPLARAGQAVVRAGLVRGRTRHGTSP